jgi:hypothetical protein
MHFLMSLSQEEGRLNPGALVVRFELCFKRQGQYLRLQSVAIPFQCLIFPILGPDAGTEKKLGRQELALGPPVPNLRACLQCVGTLTGIQVLLAPEALP